MPSQVTIPTEYEEQLMVVEYCKLRGHFYWHTPQETYTKSFNQKRRNRAMGVVAGVPDLFVIVKDQLIAIELKRVKRSSTSAAQKDFIVRLNDAGIPAKVCNGSKQAIDFINEWEK